MERTTVSAAGTTGTSHTGPCHMALSLLLPSVRAHTVVYPQETPRSRLAKGAASLTLKVGYGTSVSLGHFYFATISAC